jgi:hypothetical protein
MDGSGCNKRRGSFVLRVLAVLARDAQLPVLGKFGAFAGAGTVSDHDRGVFVLGCEVPIGVPRL